MFSLRVPLVVIAALLLTAAPGAVPAPREVRAMWVVRTTMTSPSAIATMIGQARSAGINTLLVQVRGRGDAYYRSRHEPRARALAGQPESFDPLAVVLRDAHAAGLKVHAWVNVNLVADATDLPENRRHVIYRHPNWLMVPADLAGADPHDRAFLPALAGWTKTQAATVEGLYTSPLSEDAADHVVDVVSEIASRYAVDGVHFDYIRYPGAGFDYSREALHAFRDEMAPRVTKKDRKTLDNLQRKKPLAWVDRFPERWTDYRRQRLTALLRRLRGAVLAKRPGAMVSAAVVPDAAVAVSSRLQDWPSWAAEGLLDTVCPMAYTQDLATFRKQIERVRTLARGREVWAGIGAYRLTGQQTIQHIAAARSLGANGIVLFSYDSLTSLARGADNLVRIGQQAFVQ